MNEVFSQMKKFTREGFTVIFTNHHRKKSRGPYKDDPQEQTRGSTVINAVPAGHITCEEKRDGDNTIIIIRQVKLKGAKKLGPFQIQIDATESGFRLFYKGEHLEDVDAAARLKNKLYAIIQESDRWLGIPEFKELVGMSADKAIRMQLSVLVTSGQIRRETRANLKNQSASIIDRPKTKGNEFLYFKISNEEADGELGISP